jgi:asparagine synthase (glutamine-hydrolysing)
VAPLDLKLLEAMTQVQGHRGPDGEGYALLPLGRAEKPIAVAGSLTASVRPPGPGYAVGFGHRRLAIVDLSPLGHQPMGTDDGRLWITYNGEVYNALELRQELTALGHRFRCTSDTEVVLAAYREWGAGCLPRFNGMFALAIWDARDATLFCARDRFGIKPLFFRQEPHRLAFGSEIKALLQDCNVPRRPHEPSLYAFLTGTRRHQTDESFFDGIRQLRPAEWMKVRFAGEGRPLLIVRERWWSPDVTSEPMAASSAAARCRVLLEDGVRRHLRADVPVGSCLSGGLDSSTLVCLMGRLLDENRAPVSYAQTPALRTFSACDDDPACDERLYLRAVVARTGADSHEVFPDAKRLWLEWPDLLWHQEQPVAGASVMAQWAVMQQAGRSGAKVLLDGQGADELLLGYPSFLGSRVADEIRRGHWFKARSEWAGWRSSPIGFPASARAAMARALLPAGGTQWLRQRATRERQWLHPAFVRRARDTEAPSNDNGVHRVALDCHRLDVLRDDLPTLLHYEDRNAMAWSVEARLPFLDTELADWLLRVPADLQIRDGFMKAVLREAMRGLLPDAVRLRRDKMGFVAPQDRWLRHTWRGEVEALLGSTSFASRPYWRADVARRWYDAYVRKQASVGPTVWRWISVERWLQRFCD